VKDVIQYTHKNWRKNSGYGTGGVTGDALRLERLPLLRLCIARELWNNISIWRVLLLKHHKLLLIIDIAQLNC